MVVSVISISKDAGVRILFEVRLDFYKILALVSCASRLSVRTTTYIARFKSKCLRALVSLVITAWRMASSGSFYEDLRSPLLADSMSRVIMFYSVLMLCSSCLESSIGLYFAKLGSVARERESCL